MTTIRLFITGKIQPKGRPRAAKIGSFIRIYTPRETEKFEARIKQYFGAYMLRRQLEPLAGPVHVGIKIEREIPASWSKKKRAQAIAGQIRPISVPDLDNEAKSVLDALNKVAYLDDNQVVSIRLTRFYGENPGAMVIIREVALPIVGQVERHPIHKLTEMRRFRRRRGI